MLHRHSHHMLLAGFLVVLAGAPAAAQVHKPAVRASIHDQNGDGKGDKVNDTMWEGLLRRGTNREDRAVAEFDVSALKGKRLAEVVLEFSLAVNNAGGAPVREFDVVVYAGTGKVGVDTFATKAQLIRRISFSIQANPATYRLDADRQVQAVLDGGAKFVGVRFNPIGDANFPSILTDISLTIQTEAQAAAEREIAALIKRLGDDQFKVREAAAAALLKLGAQARPQLDKASREAPDAEIRQRTKALLDRIGREQAANSGVHVVGLYEASSQHFRLVASGGEDTDWPRFCAALAKGDDKDAPGPVKRLWGLLPQDVRAIVADKDQVQLIDAFARNLRGERGGAANLQLFQAWQKLRQGLETALRRSDYYDAKSFESLALDEEAKQLLKRRQELSLLEIWVFNRRLLEASFPDAVKANPFRLEQATVPVRVAATKEPITLVLCSNESVRWAIQADKGAKIERVIVGGYHLQAVTGTDAPVTYRVYEMPDQVRAEPRYFYAHKQDHEGYPKMVDAVRQLTGKEIASFQGRYSYQGGSPLVVGAKE